MAQVPNFEKKKSKIPRAVIYLTLEVVTSVMTIILALTNFFLGIFVQFNGNKATV